MEEILKLSASNEQLIRILVAMKEQIDKLEWTVLRLESNEYIRDSFINKHMQLVNKKIDQ
jgi:hypothetical protein